MKALTNILNYILLLLMILIASCTKDAAEVDDLVRGEEYVTVRMHIPGMKAVATRAAETDNITSIVALVFHNDQLQSVTEYTTAQSTTAQSTLHPISPISGTFTIDKPDNGDVIHFLANLPANYSDGVPYVEYLNGFTNQNKTQEDVLRNLSSRDYSKLSYWGMATRNDNNAVMDVMLYRNKAMIEIKPGENCTFRQDELFIAGLDNPNNVGLLVPYNDKDGFNFDLDNNDYLTLPQNPEPLDTTVELTNYGAGYDNAYYVFEHENPYDDAYDDAKGLYVICKIGDDYYKVALHDEEGNPYPIIRNHKYTILVNDLDEGAADYSTALRVDPINLKVIETTYLVFNYTINPTVYLNGGASSTLPVQITVPQDASLTEFNITTTNFTVTSSNGGTLTETQSGYSYAGGSTTFTFIPKSGLAAGTYPITLSGSGNYLHDFSEEVIVTVDATMMAVTPGTATINMDNGQENTTLTLTKPGNVDNVKVSVSADVFNVTNNGNNEYTFTPKNSNIAAGEYTVTFADSNYSQVSTTATITVVNTPKVTFTEVGDQTIRLNGDPLSVTMNVPYGKTLSEFGIKITPATGLDVAQNGTALTLTEGVYTTTSGVSGPNNTFTFTPTETGKYTITFSGSGEGVNMPQESERTINLTVNAAAVTTMSATAVNDDSTIDLDSGDTNVTFTLTKPSGLQNVSVNITNANGSKANSYFTINANNADLYYDQYNDYFNNITDYNNTENIPITFTVKDNSIPGGEYTATFTGNYNGQNITATATITIVNTPTVSFSNTGKQTLYWNGGTKPTTFKVEMTNIPTDGSVTLSIKAADFDVSVPDDEGTITDSDGTYTYTGGNTTFTFTPTRYGDSKTITITGSGTNVKVPSLAPIIVDVKNENAPMGYVVYGPEHNASETGINFGTYKEYGLLGTNGNVDQTLIQYFKADAKLVIEFSDVSDGASMKLQSWWSNVYKSFDLTSSNDNTYTFKATDFTGGTFSNAQDYINNSGAGLCLVGAKVTITKITIIPAPTTNN